MTRPGEAPQKPIIPSPAGTTNEPAAAQIAAAKGQAGFTPEERQALLSIRDDMRKVREGLEDYLFRPTDRPPPKITPPATKKKKKWKDPWLQPIPLESDPTWITNISGSDKTDWGFYFWWGLSLAFVALFVVVACCPHLIL